MVPTCSCSCSTQSQWVVHANQTHSQHTECSLNTKQFTQNYDYVLQHVRHNPLYLYFLHKILLQSESSAIQIDKLKINNNSLINNY